MADYPSSLPSFTTVATTDKLNTTPHSTLHNDITTELLAIATELGTIPKGAYSDVKARLDAVDASLASKTTVTAGTAGNFATFSGSTITDSGYSYSTFAVSAHTHDSRYYTESEIDALLVSKMTTCIGTTNNFASFDGTGQVQDSTYSGSSFDAAGTAAAAIVTHLAVHTTSVEHNPFKVGTKSVDETDIADNKILYFNYESNQLRYGDPHSVTDEYIQDMVAGMLQNNTNISWAYDDTLATITPTISATPTFTDVVIGSTLRLLELPANGTNYISLAAPADVGASNIAYVLSATLPAAATGYYLTSNTTGTTSWAIPDHGALGGNADDDHTQYLLANGTRALSGSWTNAQAITGTTLTGTTGLTAGVAGPTGTTGIIKLLNSTNANVVNIQAGVTAADNTYTWPTGYPALTGYVLSSTTAGVMSWTLGPPGAGAAGADTQIQFNDGGAAFGAEAGFTYNKATDLLSVVNATISTSLTVSSLTPTRVPFAGTAGLLGDASTLTFTSGTGTLSATALVATGLTQYRIPVVGAAGAIGDSANLTYNGTTLTAGAVIDWSTGNTIFSSASNDTELQAAITAATAGDTLILGSRTVTLVGDITISKNLRIKGLGRNATTITTTTLGVNITIDTGSTVEISDLYLYVNTADGGGTTLGVDCIDVQALSYLYVNNCTILSVQSNVTTSSSAIKLGTTKSYCYIYDSIVSAGSGQGTVYAVWVTGDGSQLTAYNSNFSAYLGGSTTAAIYVENAGGTTTNYCTLYRCWADGSNTSGSSIGLGTGASTYNVVNAYHCFFKGYAASGSSDFDVSAGANSTVNLWGCSLFYNLTSGTLTKSGTFYTDGIDSNNVFTQVLSIAEATAPAAVTGYGRFFTKATDSMPYYLDDSSNEYPLVLAGATNAVDNFTIVTNASDQLQVHNRIENNIMLAFFKMSVASGLTVFNLMDGIMDEFEDETGVATKTNATYNSSDDYFYNEYVDIATGGSAVSGGDLDTTVASDVYSSTNQSADMYMNSVYTGGGQATHIDGNIKSVQFYIKKYGSPTGNAVAKIYAVDHTVGTDSHPTGSALATSGNFDVSTLTTSYQWITFTFSSTYVGTGDLAIVMEYSGGDGDNYVNIGVDTSTPTHSGNGVRQHYTTGWADAEDSMGGDTDVCFMVGVIDYYDTDVTDDKEFAGSGYIEEYGHALTLASDATIGGVWVMTGKGGSPSGYNIVAKLYAATGTVGSTATPTGSALATSTAIAVENVNGGSSPGAMTRFVFPTPYAATAGDYCVSLYTTDGSGSDYLKVFSDSSSPGHAGNDYKKDWGAGSYTAISGEDLGFILEGGGSTSSPSVAFDNSNTTFWSSSQTDGAVTGAAAIGYNFGSSKTVVAFSIKQHASGTAINSVKVQGSNNGSSWSDIETVAITAGATKESHTITNSTGYSYARLLANDDPTSGSWEVEEVEFFEAGVINMTLISTATTAEAAPSTGRITVYVEKNGEALTAGTDIKGYISRDGTNFTECTLVDEGDYGTDKYIFASAPTTISTASGTSMKWQITSHNNKLARIKGVGVTWG